MSNYKVYMHTNKINGKKYIGITRQEVYKRFRNGEGYRGSHAFYGAIQKYGWDSFTHEILFTGLTAKEAGKKEIELIKKYNTQIDGYNILIGGFAGTQGIKISEETRAKMSESHKNMSDETKRKMSIAQQGRTHTPETIEKIKKSHKHTSPTEEHKKHLSELFSGKNSVWYGRKHTQEEIAKIKAGSRNQEDEYKKHVRDAKLGVKQTDEHAKNNGIGHHKPVLQYSLDGVLIKEWDCQSYASKELNLKQGSISNCCRGRQNQHGGFIWKMKNAG